MSISVMKFGALGDGIHDDYQAFQSALDCGEQKIYIPQGVYNISKTLKIHSNTSIIAEKTAKIIMKSTERRTRNNFLLSNSDVENGNINISIHGGIWDGNNTAPENAKPDLFDKQGYSGTLLNFTHVENLTLSNMVLANSVTYYLRLCKTHYFSIENIDFISDQFGCNQDGLHFGGDCRHGHVKNIRALSFGQTNDDMIALNADDCLERVENFDLCRNTIEDITFENIYTENCHTIIRLSSVTATIRNITFRNVYGGFRCYGINADAARYCRTPLFKEEKYPNGVGEISHIHFENFICFPVLYLPQNFGGTKDIPRTALMIESHMDDFNISGFKYACSKEEAEACPAIVASNLTMGKICADGKEFILKNKADILKINNFENIRIDRK